MSIHKRPALPAAFLACTALTSTAAIAAQDPPGVRPAGEIACEGAAAGSAAAEECAAAANEAAGQAGIADIVVTARRRAESLQRVPESVSAFSQEQILDRRLDQITEFLAVTPNVNITADQDAATNNISIRGLGSNRNQAAAVVFSVDGVVLPDADAFTMDLSDAERVEVLRGPQGALYGRGSIGGAINITTRRPTNELALDAAVSYESGDNFRLFGTVGGPIVTDVLLARVSFTHRDGDGTIINRFNGEPANPVRQTRVSGRLIFQPSDWLEADLRATHFDEQAGSIYFHGFDVLGTTGGEITEEIAGRDPNFDGPASTDRQVTDLSLLLNIETGIGTLTSTTAYDDIKVDFREDIEVSPFPLVPDVNQIRNTDGFSQELRLTSPGTQRLRYILGGYYQRTNRAVSATAQLDLCLFLGTCINPDGSFTSSGTILAPTLSDYRIRFDQYAVFAQLSYDILETLELTVAARYDHVEGRQNDRLAGVVDEADFAGFQPKVTLAYRPNDQITAYATYSEGFKSGNFNPVSAGPAFPRVVDPENSRNFELGLRTSWLDRRLIANFAAFYTEHLNPQIFQLDAATFGQGSLNAEEVRIKGFEVELAGRPTRYWDITAAFGYVDAQIEDFDGVTDRYVGQQVPNAPKFTLNLGTAYRLPLTSSISARFRVDYRLVGRQSYQDFQLGSNPDVLLFQKSYGTFDAQASLEGEHWTLTGFVRNLFDRRHATSAFSRYIFGVALVPLGTDAVQPDLGRIVGAELRVRF